MAENVKQHYVPRSILQNFTFEGKKIFCYLKNDRRIIPSNINNICKENKYYSFDIEDENGNIFKFDYDKEVFQTIDNNISPVIRKIIENRTIVDLKEQERQILVKYTAYQYCRVPATRNIANSLLNDEQKAKIFHAEALRNDQFVLSDLEEILINLKLDIIDPIVEDEFIISDTVVLLDPTGEGIYFPISPNICLVYHHPIYDVVNCLDSICINELQLLAATQFVIAKSKSVLQKIDESYHRNHIEQKLKISENNSYWKCILQKKDHTTCILEQNRDKIIKPLKEEYDKILYIQHEIGKTV